MDDRDFLSIGEVLSLLKEEFPDVTISKIRFLESQGLLDPERTPSGYRKFYDNDVDRLRWILRQQREHFLPLKVIKGRLQEAGGNGASSELPPEATAPSTSAVEAAPPPASGTPAGGASAVSGPVPAGDGLAVSAEARSGVDVSRSGANLTLTELAAATGLDEHEVRELERFGLLSPRKVGTSLYYDEEALLVANLAASFMRFGVEARHLRMYKVGAEREATFFEQLVMPMLKQRNPEARRNATEALNELSHLGHNLRAAMLRQALREYVDGA